LKRYRKSNAFPVTRYSQAWLWKKVSSKIKTNQVEKSVANGQGEDLGRPIKVGPQHHENFWNFGEPLDHIRMISSRFWTLLHRIKVGKTWSWSRKDPNL